MDNHIRGYICFISDPIEINKCKIISLSCQDVADGNVKHILAHGNCNFEAVYCVTNINLFIEICHIKDERYYPKTMISMFENMLNRNGRIRYSKMNNEKINKFILTLSKIYQEKNIQN